MPTRSFQHIAKLIRTRRINHHKGYSQVELSQLLGYKNGQFISNVERALCNIPLKMLPKVSQILDITKEELKEAILRDHASTIDSYLNEPVGPVTSLEEHKEKINKEKEDTSTPTPLSA